MSVKVETEPGQGVKRVDLDTILVEEVGQFGRYQIFTLALVVFPVIFASFAVGEFVFTTTRIPTRCLIPQCDGENPEYAPPWVLNAIPGAGADSLEQCTRFVALNASGPPPEAEACPSALFDHTQTAPCDHYVYENTDSAVYDFNLACDEWRRTQIGAIQNIGTLVGLPLTGYISDRWGRRMVLVLGVVVLGWIGLVRSFVNSYEWFVVLQAVGSIFGCGINTSCYILVTELVGPKYRVMTGAIMLSLFTLGQVLLGIIAWAVQPWRTLTQVLYAPQMLIICYFWIITESVRWLISKGRYDKAETILKNIAEVNHKELSEKSLELLRSTAEVEKQVEKSKEPWLIVLVFRSKVIFLRCLVSPIWWITNFLVIYGLSINAINLGGTKYLSFVYVAAMEIPGSWTSVLLLDRVGRKPVLIGAYLLCAVCQFTTAFLPEDLVSLSLVAYLFSKYSIALVSTSTFLYTLELFPTKYRHSLLAFPETIGRFGSIMAPLTPALALEVWAPLPSVLFGSLALLSGLLVLTTPETLGTKLPDTIEEAEQLGIRKVNIP